MLFTNILSLPLIRDGKVRALAVSSLTRASAAPGLPTVSESGFPGFEAVAWFGLLAPAGTPPAVLQRLEAEAQKALASPAVAARLQIMGAMPTTPNAAAFRRVIQDEIARWAGLTPLTQVAWP